LDGVPRLPGTTTTTTRRGGAHGRHREVRRTLPWRRPSIRTVDVDADPEGEGLADRYGVRVPVIVLDGVELSELELAPGVVRRALAGRSRRSWRREGGR